MHQNSCALAQRVLASFFSLLPPICLAANAQTSPVVTNGGQGLNNVALRGGSLQNELQLIAMSPQIRHEAAQTLQLLSTLQAVSLINFGAIPQNKSQNLARLHKVFVNRISKKQPTNEFVLTRL